MEIPASQCIWSTIHLDSLLDHVLYPHKFSTDSILAPLPANWTLTIPWGELGHEWAVAELVHISPPESRLVGLNELSHTYWILIVGSVLFAILVWWGIRASFKCLWSICITRGPAKVRKAFLGWLPVPTNRPKHSMRAQDTILVARAIERMADGLVSVQKSLCTAPRTSTFVHPADHSMVDSAIKALRKFLAQARNECKDMGGLEAAELKVEQLHHVLLAPKPEGHRSELRTVPLRLDLTNGEQELGYIEIPLPLY